MEKQKLIYVESKALFSPSEVSDKAIVFIEDTKEIWTHGVYFSCSGTWASPITLSLTGDSTGSVSIDGSGNVTLSVTNQYLGVRQGGNDANSALSPTHKIQAFKEFAPSFANGFPATNYANAIININTHLQNYDHQLGFSSNKGIYHRTRNGGVWDSSWEKLLTSTNYTNFPHTFASLTNKPTTISGYGITDCIPIIKGGKLTTETNLADIGMTTSGAKLSVFHTANDSNPNYMFGYSNALMFRSTSDTFGALSLDAFSGFVAFIGGRNSDKINWWFRIVGANLQTYNLANIQTAINNLGSTYLPLIGGTLTGTLTSSHITPRTSVTYDIGTTSAYYNNIYALYFKRKDSSDSYVLLGGGGHKAISDFILTSSLNNYVTLSTDLTVSGKKLFNNQLVIRKDVGDTGAAVIDRQHDLLLQVMRSSNTHSVAIGVMPTGAGVIWAKAEGIGYNTLYLNPYNNGVAIGCGGNGTLPNLNDGYYFHIFGSTLSNDSITATKFIKSGGTASQFLKADGSIDSNAYLPLSGGTMAESGYIAFPAAANSSVLSNNTPMGITYGRIQSYSTLTIAADTDGSKTEFVNIVAGRNISEATAANGLSIGYNTLKWKGTEISLSGHNHDSLYLKLSGGTMTGALNFANNTWNKVGDDAYMGDCNVSGMIGIKGSNAATPGFVMYNNSGTLLGKLYASGTSLYWSDAKILTASGTSKLFIMGDGSLYSDTIRYDTWTKTTTSGIAWFPIADITDDKLGTALFMVRGYAHSSIIFTVTKGYDTGNINVLAGGGNFNNSYAYIRGVRLIGNVVEIGLNAAATYVSVVIRVLLPTFTYSLRSSLVESTNTATPYVQYDINSGGNHDFGIISSKFTGNLTGNVTGNLIGNADTASNISTVNPILALPFEKNTIQVVSNPLGALAELLGKAAAITHALRFNWYDTAYEIGNVRGGASNSLGFGITYGNNNLCLLVKTNGTYSPYGFIGDLKGNAASANKWAIARTITLTGDVTGSVTLDGSSNVTLTTTTSGTGTTSFLKCPDKRNSYPALIVTSGGNIGAAFISTSTLGLSEGYYCDTLILRGYATHTAGYENALFFSKQNSSVYHSQYTFGSTTTWGTIHKFLDSNNYSSYALPLSGGTMTGNIILTTGKWIADSTTSTSILGTFASGNSTEGLYSEAGVLVGKTATQTTLSSNGDDLWHYRNSDKTRYKILDAANYTNYTINNTKSGINNTGFVGVVNGNNLYHHSELSFARFAPTDATPSYELIAELTNYDTGVNTGYINYGISGFMWSYRGGNCNNSSAYPITAIVSVGPSTFSRIRVPVTTGVLVPFIVKYNNKYYLALRQLSSSTAFYFMGQKLNLLTTTIKVTDSSLIEEIKGPEVETSTSKYYYNNGTPQEYLHAGNYSSYALPLTGGKLTGNITVPSAFINTGDATLKFYSGKITDAKSDGNICLQTSIDGTDGLSHVYPTQLGERCNLVLLPRGGQVYIGTNPDGGNIFYKLYVNGGIYASSLISDKVGIGTTSPSEKLQVNGNAIIGNHSSNHSLTIKSQNSNGVAYLNFDNGYYNSNELWKGYIAVSGYGDTSMRVGEGLNGNELCIHGMIFKLPRDIWGYAFRNNANNDIAYLSWNGKLTTKLGYVVENGTSSQFLKADGSLDSTSYLPTAGGTLGSTSAAETELRLKSSTTTLRLVTHSSTTFNYIQSGNVDFNGSVPLQITGYNGSTGSDLYLKFNNIYCRSGNYTNIDSGNYSSYALPKSGGTMTGAISSTNITPKANNTYNLGSTSYYYKGAYSYGFYKKDSSDSYVLLGGGGHKAVSDFTLKELKKTTSISGNVDQWSIILEQSYPTGYWYDVINTFLVEGVLFGSGFLSFYAYWNASSSSFLDYITEVYFNGVMRNETTNAFGGSNRDINDYLRIYIDKTNYKLLVYANHYNGKTVRIKRINYNEIETSGFPNGGILVEHFNDKGTIVSLPTESTTMTRVLIKTHYNHDRTIKTSKSIYASSFYENSDIRLKENIRRIDLSDLTKLVDLVQFNFKDSDTKKYGVIAQLLELVGLQNLVYENDGKKAVDYISLLVLEIQRLRNEIGELKLEINKKS